MDTTFFTSSSKYGIPIIRHGKSRTAYPQLIDVHIASYLDSLTGSKGSPCPNVARIILRVQYPPGYYNKLVAPGYQP
jgi:hypothetical protein